MTIVVPGAAHSGLPWAADEVQQLRALLPFAERLTPVTRRQLGRLLDDGDAQIVHFSGHGSVGANADLTALELEGGESITAMAFAASRLGSTRQPLLFLNACTVGRGGRVLGRAGGFAGNCIEAGWSGVVAPYWPVLDASNREGPNPNGTNLAQGHEHVGLWSSQERTIARKPDRPCV